jgi:flagellar assembly protein FliH
VAMIRRADQSTVAREAVALNLGDLFRQGEAIKQAARDQAEAMLAAARAERDRISASASAEAGAQGLARGLEEGRAKGLEEGLARATAEHRAALESLEKAWSQCLESFESHRDRLLIEARQDVLRLALLIAGRVTHRVVRAEEGVVADQMAAVLAQVLRPTRLVVSVHPDDLPSAETALPLLLKRFRNASSAELTTDPVLAPGSCVARAEGGASIDASIETQLERIAEALIPSGAVGPQSESEAPDVQTAPPEIGSGL